MCEILRQSVMCVMFHVWWLCRGVCGWGWGWGHAGAHGVPDGYFIVRYTSRPARPRPHLLDDTSN